MIRTSQVLAAEDNLSTHVRLSRIEHLMKQRLGDTCRATRGRLQPKSVLVKCKDDPDLEI